VEVHRVAGAEEVAVRIEFCEDFEGIGITEATELARFRREERDGTQSRRPFYPSLEH
jgi:hypothetical protein